MALLRGDLIDKGVKLLRENVSLLKRSRLSESVVKKFEKLYDYIDSYWLTDWSLEEISFFQKDDRTNNHLESYHRGLNELFRKNPPPTRFLRKKTKLRCLTKINTVHFIALSVYSFINLFFSQLKLF